jgi:Ca-activated chloride channel homolog
MNLFGGEFIRQKHSRRINLLLHLGLCFLGISVATIGFSQSAHKHLREGDAAYLRKNYKKAELDYRNAQEAERSYKGSFNLGNSLYMQQRHDDALQIYADVAKRGIDNDMRSQAFYNQGNTHIIKNEYDKAIDAYKRRKNSNNNSRTKIKISNSRLKISRKMKIKTNSRNHKIKIKISSNNRPQINRKIRIKISNNNPKINNLKI